MHSEFVKHNPSGMNHAQFYNGLSLRVFEIVDFGLGRVVQLGDID